ncbi:MAG: FAD-binding protein [Chloroflexi bacterium]|nr:FAD-binding protein [Chloroflexota bacterium]MCL5074995.1 FAD-binding protein [Chloroflexota bacterium]
MVSYQTVETDVLVIGGGGAGARAAIEASTQGVRCTLLCKGALSRSGLTPMAYPSFEAALGHRDSRDNPEIHFQDTVREGRYLSDQNLAKALATEAIPRMLELERYGVKFRKDGERFLQVWHPGQTYPRNLVIQGGGYGLIAGLKKELRRHPEIKVLEDHMVTRLLTKNGRVVGATALDLRCGALYAFSAKAVVLATGGYEALWEKTDASPDSTGDGATLAYTIGAELVDMEMMLFYPTVLVYPPHLRGTVVQYEGLLYEEHVGGKMLNAKGEEFLPSGPLPVRDVFMRLMFDEIEQGRGTVHGGLYIDIAKSPRGAEEVEEILNRLMSLPYDNLRDVGIDIRRQPIEVAPATHYTLGGIRINERTETNISGLYAAGEVAGNVHGANRLSGNALAETQVFGTRAGHFAAEAAKALGKRVEIEPEEVEQAAAAAYSVLERKDGNLRPRQVKRHLQAIVQTYLGHKRDEISLQKALADLGQLREEDLPHLRVMGTTHFNNDWREALELPGMIDLAEAVATAAMLRKESRGHHFRTDYPEMADGWPQHTLLRRNNNRIISTLVPTIRLDEEAS